jgi:hypothetical protein
MESMKEWGVFHEQIRHREPACAQSAGRRNKKRIDDCRLMIVDLPGELEK